jgi:hypothetical protein
LTGRLANPESAVVDAGDSAVVVAGAVVVGAAVVGGAVVGAVVVGGAVVVVALSAATFVSLLHPAAVPTMTRTLITAITRETSVAHDGQLRNGRQGCRGLEDPPAATPSPWERALTLPPRATSYLDRPL